MLDPSISSPGWDGGKPARVCSCELARVGACSSELGVSGSLIFSPRDQGNFILTLGMRIPTTGLCSFARPIPFRGERPNISLARALKDCGIPFTQRTCISTSSSIEATKVLAASQNWLMDIVGKGSPNSFMLDML